MASSASVEGFATEPAAGAAGAARVEAGVAAVGAACWHAASSELEAATPNAPSAMRKADRRLIPTVGHMDPMVLTLPQIPHPVSPLPGAARTLPPGSPRPLRGSPPDAARRILHMRGGRPPLIFRGG